MSRSPAPRVGALALLEALRAPLLLSPAADVYAGWLLASWLTPLVDAPATAAARAFAVPIDGLIPLLACALAGCCLLASGMAQNALADRAEDARVKPDRPLPRGALSPRTVAVAMVVLAAAGLALLAPWRHGLPLGLAIVVGTALYHLGAKRLRVPGCLALGALRGLSLGLGVVAAAHHSLAIHGRAADLAAAWLGGGLYALYITGASLHASTDDEAEPGPWSPAGLSLCTLVLLAWTLVGLSRVPHVPWQALPALVVLLAAVLRLHRARATRPPPAITGVALSGLHLLHAGVASLVAGPAPAAAILALFGASRLLLRRYPPS